MSDTKTWDEIGRSIIEQDRAERIEHATVIATFNAAHGAPQRVVDRDAAVLAALREGR